MDENQSEQPPEGNVNARLKKSNMTFAACFVCMTFLIMCLPLN